MQYAHVTEILGGEKVLGQKISSKLDFIELASKGLSKSAVSHLAKFLSFSWRDMAELLPVTERTLQRYKAGQHMKPIVSEQVLQLATVAAMGEEVFEEHDNFLAWLSLPCAALGDTKPVELLRSRFGIDLVIDELGRIAHGIPA